MKLALLLLAPLTTGPQDARRNATRRPVDGGVG
jgi:hypothetical protein